MRPLPQKEIAATITPRIAITIMTVPKSIARRVCPMWRRLRRRTMAPGRPVLYPDQVGLAFFTLVVFAVGIYVAVRLIAG